MNILRAIFGRNTDAVVKPQPQIEAGPDPVMAALAELEVKRLRQALAAVMPPPAFTPAASEGGEYAARPNRVVRAKSPLPVGATGPAQNIWDLDELGPIRTEIAAPSPQPARPQPRQAENPALSPVQSPVQSAAQSPVQSPAPRQPTRNRTRILGFDAQPSAIVPMFDTSEAAPVVGAEALAAGQPSVVFPVGWLVVTAGPGRGSAFVLTRGVSQIGRGADQTVALDFGDMAISRQHHAAVRYDAVTHRLQIGHGGKSNLVRLNGKPLLSTETLADGDEIQIGETTLMLKVLCTSAFNWSEAEAEGDGHDMAIA